MKKFKTFGQEPLQIAYWFINSVDREAGDTITNLKLQKLLYYAQGWSLALYDKTLFEEDLEAWRHGPVVPSIYHEFKDCGWETIPIEKSGFVKIKNTNVLHVLNEVMEVYGIHSAKYLERETHKETPWLKTRGGLPLLARCEKKIAKKDLYTFFKKLDADAQKEESSSQKR